MPTSSDQYLGLQALAAQGSSGTESTGAGSRGSIVVGDTSARTTMGGGGSSGGGGGGGGGGGAGYSLGASIAEGPTTTSSGAYGDVKNSQAFGDFAVSFGSGGVSTGSGKAVVWIAGILALLGAAYFASKAR